MKNLIKASAAVVTVALFGACSWDQAAPPCAVGHGGYGAEYIKTAGPTTGACVRTGDIIGVQKYRQDDGTQDIYLKPESISALEWLTAAPYGHDYTSLASGTLASNEPNAQGFCTVATLSEATGTTIVGEDLSYTFSNVEFFVDGSTAGTQFRANLVIDDGAGCSATYDVRAMYPVVFCNELDEESPNYGQPDDAHCAEPDHVWSHYSANPLFATKCHPYGNPDHDPSDTDYWIDGSMAWQICVPAGAVPALK